MLSAPPPLAVSVAQAAQMLGLNPKTVSEMCRYGEFPSKKVGRRRLISVRAIQRWLDEDAPRRRAN